MVTAYYNAPARAGNAVDRFRDVVVKYGVPPFLPSGQLALLERIPEPGDVIDLPDAIAIVSRYEPHAYGHLVTMMNRGLVAADFHEAPSADPEIVIRRI